MYIVWFMWIMLGVIVAWQVYANALENAISRERGEWEYEVRQRSKKKNEEEGQC